MPGGGREVGGPLAQASRHPNRNRQQTVGKGEGKMQQVCVWCGVALAGWTRGTLWHIRRGNLGRANKTSILVEGKEHNLRRRDLLISGLRLLLRWALVPAQFSVLARGNRRAVHVVSRNTSGSGRKAPFFIGQHSVQRSSFSFFFSFFFFPSFLAPGRRRTAPQ